jgi:PPOX class F420-dependent enzyme/OxyR family protein
VPLGPWRPTGRLRCDIGELSPGIAHGIPCNGTVASAWLGTVEETAYLRAQPLARLATLSADGQPDVVPVSFEFDGESFCVGGSGASVLATRKFRNVRAGNYEVAQVVDDMISVDPFVPLAEIVDFFEPRPLAPS